MKRRPELTVLFAGAERVVRVDLAAGAESAPVHSFAGPARMGASLAELLRTAFADGVRPAARTLVLAETAWTQTLELEEASVAGLTAAELARAVAFELEPASGITAFDAGIAVVRLDSKSAARVNVWAVEIAAGELAEVELLLTEYDSTLVGLAHPAGLGGTASALRVEVWDQATFCGSSNGADALVLGASAGQRSWEQGIATWLEQQAGQAIEWSGAAIPIALASHAQLEQHESALARDPIAWLTALGRRFQSGELGVPRLPPKMRARRPVSTLLVGALLTLGACAFVYMLDRGGEQRAHELEQRAADLDSQLALARAATQQRAGLTKQAGELRESVRVLAGKVGTLEAELGAQEQRHAALFRALSSEKPAGVLLLGVREAPQGGLSIEGAGIDAAVVHAYAAALEPRLSAAHWSVEPLKTSERRGADGRAHVEFELELKPAAASAAFGEPAHAAPLPTVNPAVRPALKRAGDTRRGA